MDKHPDPTLLSTFVRGELSRRRNREIVRHLLTRCGDCYRIALRYLPLAYGGGSEQRGTWFDYGKSFARAWRETERRQSSLAAERSAAPELLRELLAQPLDRQRVLVTTSSRYRSWALCEVLLEASREWGFREPGQALDLAHLGVEVVARLDPTEYGKARVNDLAARAWGVLGNAQRIRSDFLAADESFLKAERLLKQGTGDPLEKAQILLLKSSLRGVQQRFAEAFRLLDRTVAIARKCNDSQLRGKALVTRGFFYGMANDLEAAIRSLRAGIRVLDPAADPRLHLAAQHNLILFLSESGRNDEAMRLLDSSRPLYHEVGDQMGLLRLRWLEGKIASSLGRFAEAEHILRDVRQELIERDLGFDTALLSLDLASLYATQGRSAEMRRLAAEMLPIFKSRDIHREAIAALFLFQKAAEMERVTLGLIHEVSSYLQESRSVAGLRSREPR
jgi:tetratricopeptide (TPR) repeat protein